VAVFIRTDLPVPPGTASPSATSLTVPATAVGTSTTLYTEGVGADPGTEVTVVSLSISTTKRSVVVAVFNCFAHATGTLRLYVAGAVVAEQVVDVVRKRLLTLHGYRVLGPGTHTVELRLYNHTTGYGSISWGAGTTDVPAGSLVVYVVPLE